MFILHYKFLGKKKTTVNSDEVLDVKRVAYYHQPEQVFEMCLVLDDCGFG